MMHKYRIIAGLITLLTIGSWYYGAKFLYGQSISHNYQRNNYECWICQRKETAKGFYLADPDVFGCSQFPFQNCCDVTRKVCIVCCKGMSASCIGNIKHYQCDVKITYSDETKCCKKMTKKCLSCAKNMTESEFCDKFSGKYGCTADIMIGILLTKQTGYTEFTASVWHNYHNISGKHIHLFGDHVLNLENKTNFQNWYGSNVNIIEPEKEITLGENIRRLFEYFANSDYKILLFANVETVVLKNWESFIESNISETDGFLSLYHSSVMHNYSVDCEILNGDLCEGNAVGTYAVALTRNLVETFLGNYQGSFDNLDWTFIFEKLEVRLLYSPKSLSMQIGQTKQSKKDNCGQNEVAYRFNRCDLPKWIRNGIEFYFDRCTSPNERYQRRKSMSDIEKEGRFWTRPVISYSLYGNKRRYIQIALENARRIFSIYPGWKIWIYMDGTVPSFVMQELCEFDIRFIDMSQATLQNQRSWRFLVASDFVKMYAIRDIDSWLLPRGKAAVDEWIQSGRKFHSMRDNHFHSKYPMNAGMWGGRHDAIPNMKELLESIELNNNYITDTDFLTNVVWKIASKSVWTHDSHPSKKFGEYHPFPTEQKAPNLFVGMIVLEQ